MTMVLPVRWFQDAPPVQIFFLFENRTELLLDLKEYLSCHSRQEIWQWYVPDETGRLPKPPKGGTTTFFDIGMVRETAESTMIH